ncbi:MAG: hypothetical protein MI922_26235, partial [Bacteroidales bacterium]|nr:hypothetical protein [Bacteroidales bacterium]
IFIICLFLLLYPPTKRGISYLDSNVIIDSDLLIIEGWITPSELQHVYNYWEEHDSRHILISGGFQTNYCKLFQNGSVIFIPPNNYDSCASLEVVAFGSQAKSRYPKMKATCHSCKTDTFRVSKKATSYVIKCKDLINDTIIFDFFNDEVSRYSDRNLFIKSVIINKDTFNLPSPFFFVKQGNSEIMQQDIVSNPDYLKHLLTKQGISDNEISILYQPQAKYISKTLLSANNSIEWMTDNGYNKAMIFTAQNHTKGTLLSYKFKSDTNMKFGIQGSHLIKHKRSLTRTKEFCRILLLKFLLLFK